MNAISLFSGIGGLDIGFAAAGFNIVAQVEIDPFCQRVLRRHAPEWWPCATVFSDVREFGRKDIPGEIEVIFGGFPCQDISLAGSRAGILEGARSGLWYEFARIIGEFRPRVVLIENVAGIVSTKKEDGDIRPADALLVISQLSEMGYDAKWGTIQATDAGAPHKRERWFCMAYRQTERQPSGVVQRRIETGNGHGDNNGGQVLANAESTTSGLEKYQHCGQTRQQASTRFTKMVRQRKREARSEGDRTGCKTVANCGSTGLAKRKSIRTDTRQRRQAVKRNGNFAGQVAIAQSRMGGNTDGIPTWLDRPRWPAGQGSYQHDWETTRTIGKNTDPNRSARIKALGNAVVPQIAYALACEIRRFHHE